MALLIPTVSIDDLRAFHAKHFPQTPAPEHFLSGVEVELTQETYGEEDDGLGYYPDGVKRTLTDEQIAMFRHSEIQAILRERRRRREEGEESEQESASVTPVTAETNAMVSEESCHRQFVASSFKPSETVQTGRIEKPKIQQWATSSERTKAKNKKNRNKYRAKKKEMRLKKEMAKVSGQGDANGEESDEWDPWHQATGPDAQKDDKLDLDY